MVRARSISPPPCHSFIPVLPPSVPFLPCGTPQSGMLQSSGHQPDFAGGTNFVVLAITTLALSGAPTPRQLVVSIFMMVWGLRLSGFLLFRILKTGKDDRFDDKRDRFFPFLGFWVFQMLWVWIVSLPVTVLNSPAVQHYFQHSFGTARDVAGVVLFVVGFLFEAVADVQRFHFRTHRDRSSILDTGLFAVSRHPNYFGEIILQFGESLNTFLISTSLSLSISLLPRHSSYFYPPLSYPFPLPLPFFLPPIFIPTQTY